MKLAVLKETFPGEKRVALAPANVAQLTKAGGEVWVESGAGEQAGFSDDLYTERGAKIVSSREEAFAADVILQVRTAGANPERFRDDLPHYRENQLVLGTCDPLGSPELVGDLARTGARLFALEMIPRITRAQSMDILSSMATIAGYRAVLLAAVELPKMFPLLMTAAGTVSAARVFVIGAGVAGLQAIATAKRLGGVVRAYDLRPDCREQVESLGGKFVELELDAADAEDKGGYAKAMDEDFYRRQRELMADVVRESDVVITTAAIPGKRSPLLITKAAVEGMDPGGVIVDLAAERGGNCELSEADQRQVHQGIVLLAPTNLPSEIPFHASQMYSNNITKFMLNLIKDGELNVDLEDPITFDTLVTDNGEVCNDRLRDILGLPRQPSDAETQETASPESPNSETPNSESPSSEPPVAETPDDEPSEAADAPPTPAPPQPGTPPSPATDEASENDSDDDASDEKRSPGDETP